MQPVRGVIVKIQIKAKQPAWVALSQPGQVISDTAHKRLLVKMNELGTATTLQGMSSTNLY